MEVFPMVNIGLKILTIILDKSTQKNKTFTFTRTIYILESTKFVAITIKK